LGGRSLTRRGKRFNLSLIDNNKSFLITGAAGTGKSYQIHQIKKYMDLKNIKYKLGSFTHTAAENIGGETLNSILNLDVNGLSISNRCKKIDFTWLIIDEFTQIPLYIYEILYKYKFFHNINIILVGDQHQLPPHKSNEHVKRYNKINNESVSRLLYDFEDMRNLTFIKELTDYNNINLEKVMRFGLDKPMIIHGEIDESYDAILCLSNNECDIINKKLFKKFNNEFVNGVIVKNKTTHNRYRIKDDKLISINKNSKDIGLNTMLLDEYTVSFALTIYSSQGQEYERYFIFQYHNLKDKNLYVAETRRKNNIIYTNKKTLTSFMKCKFEKP
jgi:ATP-dependent exoDNAse (exonuclease V) alpha subunit